MLKITPPSSKSVAHRAIIAAALCSVGKTTINNITYCDDVKATLGCIKALGVNVLQYENSVEISGGITAKKAQLNCFESASTLRFFIPIVAALGIETNFIGAESLLSRPLSPILSLLQKNGIKTALQSDKLSVSGTLTSGTYEISGDVSSQFITGLLFALSLIGGSILVTTPLLSSGYVELTIDVIEEFTKSRIKLQENCYLLEKSTFHPKQYTVEADYSAAAFFLVAAALGENIAVCGLKPASKQPDKAILDILKNIGAAVVEQGGCISIIQGKHQAYDLDVSQFPDLVPILATLFSLCEGSCRLYNAQRLRYKESDRITAVVEGINAIGGRALAGEDFIHITGVKSFSGGHFTTKSDHRLAMSAAIASLKTTSPIFIDDKQCVKKSYPDFFRDLNMLKGASYE